jgi:FkbM family methyltransferase
MYHRFKWTSVSHRRNGLTLEYEPMQPYFLAALIRAVQAKTFVDVGANIGAYSVLMSPFVASIVAYEANPAPAGELARNLELNDIDGKVRQVAVSDRAGSVEFGIVSRFAGNSAVVAGDSKPDFRETRVVEAVTLDAELAAAEEPLAMKIDVEGHEVAVLNGARSVLANRCVLQVEDFGGAVTRLLAPLGYRQIARIGPDYYFTNVPGVEAQSIFETALDAMIAANHENKKATLKRGDFSLEVAGQSYTRLARVMRRLFGGRL